MAALLSRIGVPAYNLAERPDSEARYRVPDSTGITRLFPWPGVFGLEHRLPPDVLCAGERRVSAYRRPERYGAVTTHQNRPNTALLVIDMQNNAVARAHERDAVVANVADLVEQARREGVPVVWVQHADEELARGSEGWQIVAELTPGEAEPLIEKNYGDSFEDTTLEAVLSGLGVGRLVVVGAQTDWCVRSTLHGALARGYDATLVSDAHTTEDQTEWGAPSPDKVIAHTNMYWAYQTAPGRTAGTIASKDVDFTRSS
jgi:nicotinamidase-related amidase